MSDDAYTYTSKTVKVPANLFNESYLTPVFNLFSVTPVRRYEDYQYLSYDDQPSTTENPLKLGNDHVNPPGWVAAKTFIPEKSAFSYNRRLGRLFIPTSRRFLDRQVDPDYYTLAVADMNATDDNVDDIWDNILPGQINNLSFYCGALNGGDYGYSYKIAFPNNRTPGSQNMSRTNAGYDMFQLGISQGSDDPNAEMYIKQVVTDHNMNPIPSNQDIYVPNCQSDSNWTRMQYRLNSPLIALSKSRRFWYFSLNPLDWQKVPDSEDPSQGRNNLLTFFHYYPALFICNPNQGVCKQDFLPPNMDFNFDTQTSRKKCEQTCKPIQKLNLRPTAISGPSSKGWAFRNGKCLQVSDCRNGECSSSEQECKNKNKCPCMKNMENYGNDKSNHKTLWIILAIVIALVLIGLAWFLLRKRKR